MMRPNTKLIIITTPCFSGSVLVVGKQVAMADAHLHYMIGWAGDVDIIRGYARYHRGDVEVIEGPLPPELLRRPWPSTAALLGVASVSATRA